MKHFPSESKPAMQFRFQSLAVALVLSSSASVAVAGPMPAQYYEVEEIPLPTDVAPEVGGLAFNSDGELVVVLRRHGVLIAKPAENPGDFAWRQFTDQSMHNPMGVLLESDTTMLIPQMAELTRVSDTDGDGAADTFQNVSSAWGVSGNYHETIAGPVPDGEGNWFLAIGTASHNGPTFDWVRGEFSRIGRRGRNFSAVDYKGWVMKVKPDGTMIPWASGFRANNGIAMSPSGDIWVTDNEGDWRGASPIYHVERGNFYGHASSLVWDEEFFPEKGDPLNYGVDKLDAMRTRAAVELPKGFMCNSPAEPIFDTTGGNFGPFKGQMFVGDIAGQRITRVMLEKVGGEYQGAAISFIEGSGLRGGNNRFTWSPDGKSLYVGQTYRGWGAPAEGLQRITWRGGVPFEVKEIHLTEDGFELTFTKPVNTTLARDPASYRCQSYYFNYGPQYGSPLMDQKPSDIESIEVDESGTKVRLRLGEMTAKRVYQIDFENLASADGHPMINTTLCYTANRLRAE